MIKIEVNNQPVQLDRNIRLKLEVVFPDPTDEVIKGSRVYWFDIPINDYNNNIFDNANHITVASKTRIYDCIFQFGTYTIKGKLILKEIKSFYKSSITINTFATDTKDKKLNEYALETYDIGNDTDDVISHANGKVNASYPSDGYTFPMTRNDDFYNTDNPAFDGWVNRYSGGYLKNSVNESGLDNVYNLVPYPFLFTILDMMMQELGFTWYGSFKNNDEFKKLIIYNHYALDKVEQIQNIEATEDRQDFISPSTMIFSNEIKDEQSRYNFSTGVYTADKGIINLRSDFLLIAFTFDSTNRYSYQIVITDDVTDYYDSGEIDFTSVSNPNENISLNELFWVPNNSTNLKMKITIRRELVGGTVILSSGSLQDGTLIYENNSLNNLNIYDTEIDLKNHVPTITTGNFLNALAKMFTLGFFFNSNEKTMQVELLNDIIDSPHYLDLTSVYIKDTEEIELQDNEFQFDWNFQSEGLLPNGIKDISQQNNLGEFKENFPTGSTAQDVCLRSETNMYYIYKYFDALSGFRWETFTDNHDIYNQKEGSVEIKPAVMPMLMRDNNYPFVTFPETSRTGISKAIGTGEGQNPFMLLYYIGLYNGFPWSTSQGVNYNGDDLIESKLRWDKLYQQTAENYYSRKESSDINTFRFRPNQKIFSEIMDMFLASTKQGQPRKFRIVNKNYIPIRFQFILTMKGIEDCEGEGW